MKNIPKRNSEGTAVVIVLATILDRLLKANAHLCNLGQGEVTKFHALKAPELNVHRVVITVLLLTAKCFNDAYYNNAYYAMTLFQLSVPTQTHL